MTTDGGGTADAGRRLAGRIRAAAAQLGAATLDGTRRSLAAAQNRLPEPAALPSAPEGGAGRSIAAATLVAPEVGAHSEASGAGSAAGDPAPDQPDQPDRPDQLDPVERRLGPAILRAADAYRPAPRRVAAAWAWRLLLIAAIVYLAFKVTVALRLLVLPFIAAILLCALLQPLAAWLNKRLGLPRLAATWVTLLAAI